MQSFRLAVASLLIMILSGMDTAYALSVDTSTDTKSDGSEKFGDPDDKIPFPHVADDGSQPANNLQAQPVGGSGISFGLTPSNGEPDAFQRAQERMQQ